MNPEIREEWVAALLSGNYKQGKHLLRNDDNGFCCLGVLCDLAVEKGLAKWAKYREDSEWYIFPIDADVNISIDGRSGLLPKFIMNWAGLTLSDPVVSDGQLLSVMNDFGKHFSEIAQAIESDL